MNRMLFNYLVYRLINKIKIIILYVILLLAGFSCTKKELSGDWMATHEIITLTGDEILMMNLRKDNHISTMPNKDSVYLDTVYINELFRFKKDSVEITFFYPSDYDGYISLKLFYEIRNDSILIYGENGIFRASIDHYTNELLELSYFDEFEQRINKHKKKILTPLGEFGQASSKENLLKELPKNLYIDDIEHGIIEFTPPTWRHMGEIVYNDLLSKYSLVDNWFLKDFGEELFLCVGDKIYQVVALTDDGIRVVGYEKDIQFKLIEKQKNIIKKYTHKQLVGKWYRKENIELRNKKPAKEDYYINVIEFTEGDELIIKGEKFRDTLYWNFNNSYDKIVVAPRYLEGTRSFWKIASLSKDQVIFEGAGYGEIERFFFERN